MRRRSVSPGVSQRFEPGPFFGDRPKQIEERPALVALGLEWPMEVFVNTSDETRIGGSGDTIQPGRSWTPSST